VPEDGAVEALVANELWSVDRQRGDGCDAHHAPITRANGQAEDEEDTDGEGEHERRRLREEGEAKHGTGDDGLQRLGLPPLKGHDQQRETQDPVAHDNVVLRAGRLEDGHRKRGANRAASACPADRRQGAPLGRDDQERAAEADPLHEVVESVPPVSAWRCSRMYSDPGAKESWRSISVE